VEQDADCNETNGIQAASGVTKTCCNDADDLCGSDDSFFPKCGAEADGTDEYFPPEGCYVQAPEGYTMQPCPGDPQENKCDKMDRGLIYTWKAPCPTSSSLKELTHFYDKTSDKECKKTYDNCRSVTNDGCVETRPEGVAHYGGSYARVADKDITNSDPWSFEDGLNLTRDDWDGSFNNYTYVVTVPANVMGPSNDEKDILISGKEELYTNGSFAGTTVNPGESRETVSLLTNDVKVEANEEDESEETGETEETAPTQTEDAEPEYYTYSGTAVNCELSLASRTVDSGTVYNTKITAEKSATAYTWIEIDPETAEFKVVGDGTYSITLRCSNVVVFDPELINNSEFVRYDHPDVSKDGLQNVRMIDFNRNEDANGHTIVDETRGNPKIYGGVDFESGSSNGYGYEEIGHLKYWANVFDATGNEFRNAENGDFFIILWDYTDRIASLKWAGMKNNTGKIFGQYTDNYSFSGLHRVFIPYEIFENPTMTFDTKGAVAFVFGGFTLPVNYALTNNGYQGTTGELGSTSVVSSKTAVKNVTADACAKLKGAADTVVYVVKYKVSDAELGDSKDAIENCLSNKSSPYLQSASSEEELSAALRLIAANIKTFSDYENSEMTEEVAGTKKEEK
jgi:hypothetical protein